MLLDIEHLKKHKVDQSIFDFEIEAIKNLINQLGSSGKEIKVPVITQQGPSLKEWKDLLERVKILEDDMVKKMDKSVAESELKSHQK